MIQVVSKIYVLILSGVLLSFNISAQKIIVKASVPDQSLMLGRFYNGHEYLIDSFAVKNGKAVLLSCKLLQNGYYTFYFAKSERGADFIISGDQEFTIKISKDLKQVRYKGSRNNECIFNNRQCNAESGSFAEALKKNIEVYKRCSGRRDSLECFFSDFDYSSDFRLHPVFFIYLRSLEIQNEEKFIILYEGILAKPTLVLAFS